MDSGRGISLATSAPVPWPWWPNQREAPRRTRRPTSLPGSPWVSQSAMSTTLNQYDYGIQVVCKLYHFLGILMDFGGLVIQILRKKVILRPLRWKSLRTRSEKCFQNMLAYLGKNVTACLLSSPKRSCDTVTVFQSEKSPSHCRTGFSSFRMFCKPPALKCVWA